MIVELVLLALAAAGFVLGYASGGVRMLLSLGVWVIAFVAGAHARPLLAEWLSRQWFQFGRPYVEMLSFGILFLLLLGVGLALAHMTGVRTTLTRRESLDDLIGGVLGVVLVAVVTLSVYVILATFHAQGVGGTGEELTALRNLYAALGDSIVVDQLRSAVLPALSTVLGPVLPSDVPPVMR